MSSKSFPIKDDYDLPEWIARAIYRKWLGKSPQTVPASYEALQESGGFSKRQVLVVLGLEVLPVREFEGKIHGTGRTVPTGPRKGGVKPRPSSPKPDITPSEQQAKKKDGE